MKSIIETIKEKAKKNIKTIVLPETEDPRIIKATKIILKEKIAKIILIGKEKELLKNHLNDPNLQIIDPQKSPLTEQLIKKLYNLRKEKGMTPEEAKKLILNDKMYYACMLVKEGYADGAVSGACHTTSDTIRPALQIIKTKPNTKIASSFFIMEVPNCKFGDKGKFIFADCGIMPNPTEEELAEIAGSSANSFKSMIGDKPKVAMLSFSSKGSAKHESVDKVREATIIAQKKYKEYTIDGELQLDAAIIPEVAKMKAKDSKVAGKANVLIFPDLNSGNIGYKLVQRLAHAKAYGPITQGIAKPVNDLSRGCNVEDIVGVVAITAVQANN